MTRDARWSAERAHAWSAERGWRVGCNFTPSSAASPLEMWQADTHDAATIDRELGFATALGFTSVRVFLHDQVWASDRAGLVERFEAFLAAAEAHGIGTLPVLFDGVWNPRPRAGPQPEPRERVHNAGWVQSPGAETLADPARREALRPYVEGLIDAFRDDARIDGWDLFNEPDNPNPAYLETELPDKAECAAALVGSSFAWAREVAPSQPLTVGVWRGDWRDPEALSPIDRLCLENSDIVSFHHYGPLAALARRVEGLAAYGRPLWCTEFMARTAESTFDPHLGWMKERGVGAYCWGLVAGRTQTQYPWDSWMKRYDAEPDPWFHEILHADGSAWDEAERDYITRTTGGGRPTPP